MRRRRGPGGARCGERLEDRQLLAAVPVITEFMAVNDAYLVDEDGQFNDWLELANLGDQPAPLGGWYLSDEAANPAKWPLPDLVLAPGEHRLLFASAKDRRDPSKTLHTNFRLDGDGEFLGLAAPDGVTWVDVYQPSFPPQVANVSYGVFGPQRQAGYFALPSPGAANTVAPDDLPPQAIVINEIMYHPASENDADEYLELLNLGSAAVELNGWRISGGVDVQLPAITLPAGGSLVVAADVNRFQTTYGPVSPLAGPWTGRLSNSSDTITLRDALDRVVDRVHYADEGDWAQRQRGPDDRGHFGWVWADDHDGGGRSLELVNARLPNEFGQNWSASLVVGGTPGAVNSVASSNAAPLIIDPQQSPIIPRATDAVTVSARIVDESPLGLQAALNWRVDGAASFVQTPMVDNGLNGDLVAGDGIFQATVPAQPDRTVIEYFISARDNSAHLRTWPAATADAGQVTNGLYQVIDEFDPQADWQPGSPPVYYQIMTAAERDEFTNINRASDAQMNATFISVNGDGVKIRHSAGVRIRGSGSRNDTPPNNRINLPSDRPWEGVTALNLNVVSIQNQIAGSVLFRLAGLPAAEATGVVMYSNGVNLRGGQLYAHLEPLNSDFATNHYPDDASGNLYKGRRPNESPPGGQGAGLVYFGPDPAPYVSYTKLTNESQADWSDVIQLTDVLNNAPDGTYVQDLAQVVDIDEWLRFFAMNALLSNTEAGLANGDRLGDDYAMYRGVEDPRFQMVVHDLDSILSQVQRGFFNATNVPALDRLLRHPEIRPRYYQKLLELVDEVLLGEGTENTLRQALSNAADAGQIDGILNFLRQRANYVRSVIPQGISLQTALPQVGERVETAETALGLWGTADYRANSVLVNGVPAQFFPADNSWQIGSSIAVVVPYNSTWQYLDDGSDQGTAWSLPNFVPGAAWKTGDAELGYGDGDETTVVGYGGDDNNRFITTYFRQEFQVADASRYASLILDVIRDDGVVAYLNGQEIVRNNLPGNQPIDYQTLANNDISGGAERTQLSFAVDPALLVNGKNVLAVEVHQSGPRSGDLSFNGRLRGRFNPPNSGVPLRPGVNYLVVQAMSGVNGTGDVLATQRVDVWRQQPARIVEGTLPAGETTWTAAAGPYQVRGQLVVPADGKLTIEAGTSVYFEAGAELLVNGVLIARGTEQARIRLTSVPGVPDVPNLPSLPPGPPRWKGVHFVGTLSAENAIDYADIHYAQDPQGAIGVIDSAASIAHVSFAGTHRRMIYGMNASMVVRDSVFPDMFAANESPVEIGLDNVAEHIKIVGRTPAGGQLIIQGNRFGTNRGHNDVIDADSNRIAQGPILQVLDNVFAGSGDELLDLGGDVFVAGNLFMGVNKDDFTSDRGYANVISTGDAGVDTTIVVTRNVFYDVDHAINLRNHTATIFEHNTVVKVHPDFVDRFGNPNVGSVVNLFVDEPTATSGRGAYVAQNIIWDAPRVFGNADLPEGTVSPLQLDNNLLSPELAQTRVGQRPGTILALGRGNVVEDPRLVAPDQLDFRVRPGSAALAPTLPIAWGADVSGDAWIAGVPASPTPRRDATLTVGGPGLFAFRYRVNEGAWSPELPIGAGFNPSGTVRTATIPLTGLADGTYQVEVQGKDFAGNWQLVPTASESWIVAGGHQQVLINEVLASNQTVFSNAGARPDLIELYNAGGTPVNLRGMRLSDNALRPDKFSFATDLILPAGGYLTLVADDLETDGIHVGFSLRREGEGVFLYDAAGTLADSVEFGSQVTDFSIGRVGPDRQWQLTQPTFGAANVPARTGDDTTLRINEWLAGAETGDDFVELFNPDPLPVDLSGLWLSDAGGTPDLYQFAPLSFVAGQGFVVLIADGKPQDGPEHLNFQLSTHQETLSLSGRDLRIIDLVAYGPQTVGNSQGRQPDGAQAWSFFELPSPGWHNGAGFPGDLNRDGLLDSHDVDLLCGGVRSRSNDPLLDLNRDGQVDLEDMRLLIEGLLDTNFGDSNVDGVFDSRDLVQIFAAGQYEDNVPGNSTWASGDWNCDGDFGTQDLVLAFQAGAYVAAASPAATARGLLPPRSRQELAAVAAFAQWDEDRSEATAGRRESV